MSIGHTYFDVLAGCDLTIQDSSVIAGPAAQDASTAKCNSLFFPGCAFINFGLSVTDQAYQDLLERGVVEGVSLVCCGKILAFEDETGVIQARHRELLVQSIAEKGITHIVAACPNCVDELRDLLQGQNIEIETLPQALLETGLSVEIPVLEDVLSGDGPEPLRHPAKIAIHDPCSDRKFGIFAQGVRNLFPAETMTELEHSCENSRCCGSLARAAGRPDVMESQAEARGEEGVFANADALITSCMSCANILGRFQQSLPVHHYLEFIYNERIDWKHSPAYMEFRVLFEELHGKRDYQGVL